MTDVLANIVEVVNFGFAIVVIIWLIWELKRVTKRDVLFFGGFVLILLSSFLGLFFKPLIAIGFLGLSAMFYVVRQERSVGVRDALALIVAALSTIVYLIFMLAVIVV